MMRLGKPSSATHLDASSSSLGKSHKFIRKSQSQQFNTYQNMLKYSEQSQSLDNNNNSKSKPLSRKNSQQNGRLHSLDKLRAKAESVANRPQPSLSQNPIENIAMHMCAHIFLKATTRFYEQFKDLSSMRDTNKAHAQRKRISLKSHEAREGQASRERPATPKKVVLSGKAGNAAVHSPSPSIASILNKNTPRNDSQQNTIVNNYRPVSRPGLGPHSIQNSSQKIMNPEKSDIPRQPITRSPAYPTPLVSNSLTRGQGNQLQSKSLSRPNAKSEKQEQVTFSEERTPESNAYHMAGHIFMSSSTRFIKETVPNKQGEPARYPPPGSHERQRAVTQPSQQRGQTKLHVQQTPVKATIEIQSKTELDAPSPKTFRGYAKRESPDKAPQELRGYQKALGSQSARKNVPELVDNISHPYSQNKKNVQTEGKGQISNKNNVPATVIQRRKNPVLKTEPNITERRREVIRKEAQNSGSGTISKEDATAIKSPFTRQPVKGGRAPLIFANKGSEDPSPNTTGQLSKEVKNTPLVAPQNHISGRVESSGRVSSPAVENSKETNRNHFQSRNPSQQTEKLQNPQQAAKNTEHVSGKNVQRGTNKQQERGTTRKAPERPAPAMISTSKSEETFQRLWKPQRRITKPDQSILTKLPEPQTKAQPKTAYYHQRLPNEQKVNDSSKVQASTRYSRKPNFDQNVNSIAQQKLNSPQSLSNRSTNTRKIQPLRNQPINSNKSINTSNQSPKTNTYQPKGAVSQVHNSRVNSIPSQSKIISPPVTQPTSTKSIPHSEGSLKNSLHLRNEKHPEVKSPPQKQQPHIIVKGESQPNIPIKQNIKEEQSLVKSSVLTHLMVKLVRKTKKMTFLILQNNKKAVVRHSQESALLAYSASTIIRTLVLNIFKDVFSQLKKFMISDFKVHKQIVIAPAQTKEKVVKLLNSFVQNKRKDVFKLLKKKSWELSQFSSVNSSRKITLLNSQEKVKRSTHDKQILTPLISIFRANQISHLRTAFDKICSSFLFKKSIQGQPQNENQAKRGNQQFKSPPKTKDLSNIRKILLAEKINIEENISTLEYSISDKRRYLDREKAKLIKKMEDLKKKNQRSQTQVTAKRQKQNDLKKKISLSSCSGGQEQSSVAENPEDETILSLLSQVYAQVFRSGEGEIDYESLTAKFSLNRQRSNTVIDQWILLEKNMGIKRELSNWEGSDKKEGSLRKAFTDEKKVETELMRSYLRERYLWEWLRAGSCKL